MYNKKNKMMKNLATIPEVKPQEKDVSRILQTLKEERKSPDKKIKISFQFLNRDNKLFNIGEIEKEWFISLIDVLKLLSSITRKELKHQYKDKFHPHQYADKEKLNYKDEMLTNPQYEAYQLRLDKSSGRLHGFFVENTYYVIFIDRWHNMYNDKKYGGIQYKSFPITQYDKLEQQYNEKVIEVQQYIEKNQKLKTSLEKSFAAVCNNCSECKKVNAIYSEFEI